MGLPDLSGMIGNMLSDPQTLKTILNVASGLKSVGLFDMAQAPSSDGPSARSEGENGRAYSGDADTYTVKNGIEALMKETAGKKGAGEEDEGHPAAPPSNTPPYPLPTPSLPAGDKGHDREPKDQRRQLLLALRPYMSSDRQEKIDSILQIFAFLELAERFGGVFGADRGREGGS